MIIFQNSIKTINYMLQTIHKSVISYFK